MGCVFADELMNKCVHKVTIRLMHFLRVTTHLITSTVQDSVQ